MKPNHNREEVDSAGPRRLLVRFALAYPISIPMRDASSAKPVLHAALFLPSQLIRPTLIR
jgi:hypothetical protein